MMLWMVFLWFSGIWWGCPLFTTETTELTEKNLRNLCVLCVLCGKTVFHPTYPPKSLFYFMARIRLMTCHICSSDRIPFQPTMAVPDLPVLMRQNR